MRIITLVGVLLLASCSTEPKGDALKDIIPLKTGNVWIYDSELFDSVGVSFGVHLDTTKIVGDTTIANESWFWSYSRANYAISRFPAKVNPSGYLVYDFQKLIDSGILRYKYPGSVGESYLIKLQFLDSLYYYSRRIISVDTTITVPSGTYSCYLYYNSRVRLTDFAEITESEYFISPGTGIVRNNFYRTSKLGVRYLFTKSELKQLTIQ